MHTTLNPPSETVALPHQIAVQLEEVSKARNSDPNTIAVEALSRWLNEESTFIARLRKSQEQAKNRQFASPEQVQAVFSKYGC